MIRFKGSQFSVAAEAIFQHDVVVPFNTTAALQLLASRTSDSPVHPSLLAGKERGGNEADQFSIGSLGKRFTWSRLACPAMRGIRDGLVIVITFEIVIVRTVARLLRPFDFFFISRHDRGLHLFTADRVDWMGDVSVQLRSSIDVAGCSLLVKTSTTLIAVTSSQVILVATMRTAICQLTAGHGNKETLGPFDDFQISDDKLIVEGDTTERMESFVVLFDKLDTDFGDFHYRLLWLSLARTNHKNQSQFQLLKVLAERLGLHLRFAKSEVRAPAARHQVSQAGPGFGLVLDVSNGRT